MDGTFITTETASGVVPFNICGESFDKMYVLVDGIYPQYSRFVKTLSRLILDYEKQYCQWQEAVRKDIERAFEVLQGKFQYMARPLMELNLETISNRVNTCLLLHNMCVADRVMSGDVRARYNPDANVAAGEIIVEHPDDLEEVQALQGALGEDDRTNIGWANIPNDERDAVIRRDSWIHLLNTEEHNRLHFALVESVTGFHINYV